MKTMKAEYMYYGSAIDVAKYLSFPAMQYWYFDVVEQTFAIIH